MEITHKLLMDMKVSEFPLLLMLLDISKALKKAEKNGKGKRLLLGDNFPYISDHQNIWLN